MRILFINSREDSLKNPGGDTVQMQKTQSALEEMGHVVLPRHPNELEKLPACDIAHIFNIQMPESAWKVLQTLDAAGIPVVLSPIYWDMYAYWYNLASAQKNFWRPLISILGKQLVSPMYIAWQRMKAPTKADWKYQRRLLQSARRILPNSKSEAHLLKQSFAFGSKFLNKVDVVPNGIDPSLYEPAPVPSQQFLEKFGLQDFVLCVGTIYPVKNQLGIIEALTDIPVPIVFIGHAQTDMPEYAQTCKEIGARHGNVTFIDRIPHEQLPGIYALAAVHVLPSWRETPGLVSLEAAAAGCRIVSTSIGSAYDYFGDLAWYCHPNDQQSIRSAVRQALKATPSPELRKRVLNQFTWQRAAEDSLKAYENALSPDTQANTTEQKSGSTVY
jgi:glycosyltransferase involved in cell wall biosynthesis